MPRYEVLIERSMRQTMMVSIEADSPEQAKELAESEAIEVGNFGDWQNQNAEDYMAIGAELDGEDVDNA